MNMLPCYKTSLPISLFLFCLLVLAGLVPAPVLTASETSLFLDTEPLEMVLISNLKELCRDKDNIDCEDTPAKLVYSVEGKNSTEISIQLRGRGDWRLKRKNCVVPPLFLKFPDEGLDNTLFSGQKMLPLTTHCQNVKRRYNDYVLKEYLAYRLYNLFSPKSVRVRLVRVRYRKNATAKMPPVHYGFLSEHFDSVASRNDSIW